MEAAPTLFLLLIVASVVAIGARRLRLPYTVTLVVAGLALGFIDHRFGWLNLEALRLTPELLFTVFLPALLFEAAFHLSWPKFKANLRAILLLAVPGVLLAIAIAGALAYVLEPLAAAELPLLVAFLFVAMCAATDPVSVIALFKELGVPKRLLVLMEGESLLNDGVAVVAFIVLSAVLGLSQTEETVSATWIARFLLWEIVVGIGIGVTIGLIVSYVTTLVSDHLIEIMLTTIAAFGSYLCAEWAHASPVLAVVAAGMASGNVGARFGMTPTNRIAVESFWEYAVFAANSLVFLLLGKEIDVVRMAGHWLPILIAWGSLMIARALVVMTVSKSLQRTSERLPNRWPAVLIWGGLRGSLSMVLALSLPTTFEHRDLLIDLTFGVVLISILVQGMTMNPLLRWSGAIEGGDEHRRYMHLRGQLQATREAARRLDEGLAKGEIHRSTYDALRAQISGRENEIEANLENLGSDTKAARTDEMQRAAKALLDAERSAVQRAVSEGSITDKVARTLLDEITARALTLEHGEGTETAPLPKDSKPGENEE